MSLGHTTYTQKITDTAGDCMKYLHSYWGNRNERMTRNKSQDIIRKLYMNHSIKLQHPHKCTQGLTYDYVDVIYTRPLK
jgi:hypothetical protein